MAWHYDAINTRVGDVTIEWDFEEVGSSGNGWDDAGDPTIICVVAVWQQGDEVLKWFMPNADYGEFETCVYESDSAIGDALDDLSAGSYDW